MATSEIVERIAEADRRLTEARQPALEMRSSLNADDALAAAWALEQLELIEEQVAELTAELWIAEAGDA